MKLAIKTNKLADGRGYIAQVDWSAGDAGEVGTPGAVAYGDTALAASQSLQTRLKAKGHTVIPAA